MAINISYSGKVAIHAQLDITSDQYKPIPSKFTSTCRDCSAPLRLRFECYTAMTASNSCQSRLHTHLIAISITIHAKNHDHFHTTHGVKNPRKFRNSPWYGGIHRRRQEAEKKRSIVVGGTRSRELRAC